MASTLTTAELPPPERGVSVAPSTADLLRAATNRGLQAYRLTASLPADLCDADRILIARAIDDARAALHRAELVVRRHALPGDQGREHHDQTAEQAGEGVADGHSATIAPASPARESDR